MNQWWFNLKEDESTNGNYEEIFQQFDIHYQNLNLDNAGKISLLVAIHWTTLLVPCQLGNLPEAISIW